MVQTEGMLQTLVRYQECPALRNKNGKENAIKKKQQQQQLCEHYYYLNIVDKSLISHCQNRNSWT